MQRIGMSLIVTGLVSGLALRFIELPTEATIVYWLPMLGLLLGATLLYRGKQLAGAQRMRELSKDPRPPVVYLRSFAHDESAWVQILTSLLTARIATGFASDEEQLAQAVAPIGPLVTVGQPGESLPRPGALRAYAGADWQQVVDGWLARARLVILRPGSSAGVWWETVRAIETLPPQRLLILFVRAKAKHYREFADGLSSRCGIALPPFEQIARWRRVFGFVCFGDDWTPRFMRFRAPYWRGGFRPLARGYNYTLRSVFERLGVPWTPGPVSALRIAAAGIIGLMFLLFAAAGIAALASSNARAEYEAYDAHLDSMYSALSALDSGVARQSHDVSNPYAVATPSRDWETRTISGILVTAPGLLEPVQQPPESPEEARRTAEVIESIDANAMVDPSVHTNVTRFRYRPEVVVTMDGAVRGYLEGVAAAAGVSAHRANTTRTQVGEHSAIRASQHFLEYGQPQHVEILAFAVGQSLWLVQVISLDSAAGGEYAEQILRSVAIAP